MPRGVSSILLTSGFPAELGLDLKPNWMLAALLLALALSSAAAASPVKVDSTRTHNRIAVLDLVDLGENQVRPEASDVLRKALEAGGNWSVINRDSVVKKLTEFNINPHQGCNNPQCGFDVGNVVQADYVVYGTFSTLGLVQAVTLKLLNIATAKIVWTRVGEVQGFTDPERQRSMERLSATIASELSQTRNEPDKSHHGKSLAVIDLSENSPQSRVFFERVCTRIYGNPNYDLMSPTELGELLTALEINKYSIVPSLENMIGLGQKLGVSGLLYSRLYRDGKSYIYRLAMYDVTGKALVLELPPQPSEDLLKLLDYEKVFFNTLFSKDVGGPVAASSAPAAIKDGGKSNKALWISLGVLGVGGGIAAYWVESLSKSGGTKSTSGIQLKDPPTPPYDDRDK
jgi:hypothetical protein